MRRSNSVAYSRYLWMAGIFVAIGAGCSDSHSPTAPTVNPTPTPAPAADISGAWTGKFSPADFVDCDTNTPAQAMFNQNGSTVSGVLNATENACGFSNVAFQGVLQGNSLKGTVTGDRFNGGTLTGTPSGATLEIALTSNCPGIWCIPGGQMHLHR